MRYLGIAKKDNGIMVMPDAFEELSADQHFEVIEVSGDILLVPSPLDRERLAHIEALTKRSIEEHRRTLEGLAR